MGKIKSKTVMLGLAFLTLGLMLLYAPGAQANSIYVSGFNADEIFETPSVSSITATVDVGTVPSSGFAWPQDFYLGAMGLPGTGQIVSATGSGVTYQLQSYSGSNALRMGDGNANSATIAVSAGQYAALHILAASGNAAATGTSNIILNFAGGLTSTYMNALNAPDWYDVVSGTTTAAISGLDRVNSAGTSLDGSHPASFAMYETVLNLTAADQVRTLESITFNLASDARVTNIYAVDGAPVPLPSTLLLLGSGLTGLGLARFRKKA